MSQTDQIDVTIKKRGWLLSYRIVWNSHRRKETIGSSTPAVHVRSRLQLVKLNAETLIAPSWRISANLCYIFVRLDKEGAERYARP